MLKKIIIFLILLVATLLTFTIGKFNLNSASYPVPDGSIISSPNKIDTIHISYLLIKSGDSFLFNNLSKEIKTKELSIVPSYVDRYSIHKELLDEESLSAIDLKIQPYYLEEKYLIKYTLSSTKYKAINIGIENIAKNSIPKQSDKYVEIQNENCKTKIDTKNKYLEYKNSIIWYEGTQGDNLFDISFSCNE